MIRKQAAHNNVQKPFFPFGIVLVASLHPWESILAAWVFKIIVFMYPKQMHAMAIVFIQMIESLYA